MVMNHDKFSHYLWLDIWFAEYNKHDSLHARLIEEISH